MRILFLKIRGKSMGEVPKGVLGHPKMLQVLALLPVRKRGAHDEPQTTHVLLPKSLTPWCCPELSRSSQEADDPLKRGKDYERGGKKQPHERPPTPTQAALLARIEPKAARVIQPHDRGHTKEGRSTALCPPCFQLQTTIVFNRCDRLVTPTFTLR